MNMIYGCGVASTEGLNISSHLTNLHPFNFTQATIQFNKA